jgi:hypothetical protein
MFIIEDEIHAEPLKGNFGSFEAAVNALSEISKIPWDVAPNKCPCTNWKTCERNYQIIEYNTEQLPLVEIQKIWILTVSAKGVFWNEEIKRSLNII